MVKEMISTAGNSLNLGFLLKLSDVVVPDPVLVVYREWYEARELCVRSFEREIALDLVDPWIVLILIWEDFVVWAS